MTHGVPSFIRGNTIMKSRCRQCFPKDFPVFSTMDDSPRPAALPVRRLARQGSYLSLWSGVEEVMRNIRLILIVFLLACPALLVVSRPAAAEPSVGPVLWECLEAGHALDVSLVEMLYARRLQLRIFLRKHLGDPFIEKNERSLLTWSDEPVISVRLSSLLKSRYPGKKERNRIVAAFHFPSTPTTELQRFRECLNRLLHLLRGPLPDGGYRYVRFSKTPGGNADTQKLVARHPPANPQRWQRTHEGKVYRVHIYSPSKRGMFGGNRDAWLERLLVDYRVGQEKKTWSKPLRRFLKRGESIDIDLPEIVDAADVSLFFGCKPEHSGKAEFFVEFVKAAQQDVLDAPDAGLIAQIKSFGPETTLRATRDSLATLLQALGTRMTGAVRSAGTKPDTPAGDGKDQLRYFLYMLEDQTVKRAELVKRYRSMFGF